jgi:hypothetical protein
MLPRQQLALSSTLQPARPQFSQPGAQHTAFIGSTSPPIAEHWISVQRVAVQICDPDSQSESVVHSTQMPSPMHWPGHAGLDVHSPIVLQVWGTSPLHCRAPGLQTPTHAPFMQALAMHALPFCHWPWSSQVRLLWPLHDMAPGMQLPVHAPSTHALVQLLPVVQPPEASHVSTLR